MKLDVYLGNEKTGSLFSTDNRGVVFAYDEQYLSNPAAKKLSVSLPLRKQEFSQKECIPFFSGLLPEEDYRRKIAAYLHVSETSTLKLLEALGGECAGLVTITSEENPLLQKQTYSFDDENYEELSEERLNAFIQNMNERPLIKADDKLRLSLTGVQEKLSLANINGKWHLPLNGSPSTHILKPTRSGTLSSLAQNEYICMKLAGFLSLDVPPVDLINLAEKDVFVVKRYDRLAKDKTIQRLHQEDFCQALGLMSEQKYQADGGPGIADMCALIKKTFTVPAITIKKLLGYVVFNYLIGNCDCHGKNYSILYDGKSMKLAPLYDVVSTTIYPGLSDKLSMKIGKQYEIKKVSKNDFFQMAQDLDLNPSAIYSVFDAFATKLDDAFDKLLEDKKVNADIASQLKSGIKERMDI